MLVARSHPTNHLKTVKPKISHVANTMRRMARYAKTSLYPDVPLYGTTDTGERVSVEFSANDSRHLHQRVKEMLAAGLQIPVAIEHQSSAKPMYHDDWERYLAERAWATCGYLVDAEVMPDGKLKLIFEVPNSDDAKRVEVIKFVSPEIMTDFVDGSGRMWDGMSITHLAVTPKPVQHIQDSVTRLSLSQRNRRNWPGFVRLSLGASNMAEEYEDLDNTEEIETEEEEIEETESDEGGEEEFAEEDEVFNEEPEVDPVSTARMEAISSLAGLGIMLPDNVENELEFYKFIQVAAMNAKPAMEPDGDEEELPEEDLEDEFVPDETMPTGVEEAPDDSPVMLSMAKISKLEKVYVDNFKQKIRQRIAKVEKNDPDAGADLLQKLPAVRFSLGYDKEGQPRIKKNAFTIQLETAERLTNGKKLRPSKKGAKRFSVQPAKTKIPAKPNGHAPDKKTIQKMSGGRELSKSAAAFLAEHERN